MDYISYMEKLGIGFCDEEKQRQFRNRIKGFLYSNSYIIFDREQENRFAYSIGESSIIEEELTFDVVPRMDSPRNIQRVWLYLENKKEFKPFLAALMVFANDYNKYEADKKTIMDAITNALKDSHLDYDVVKDCDGVYLFPKGAHELDAALVAEPLEWLSSYPKSHATFVRALRQYSDGKYVRDVADNFRKALEEFFQEVLGNTKNLDNNKADICRYLNSHNAEPEIASMMQALLNSYNNLNNSAAKHNDKLDPRYLEFLMYQTGLIIRMIITVGATE